MTRKDPSQTYFRTKQNRPFNPFWRCTVALCATKEEIFEEVEPDGFINPDALNEVTAQGLYTEYLDRKHFKQERDVNIIDKIIND